MLMLTAIRLDDNMILMCLYQGSTYLFEFEWNPCLFQAASLWMSVRTLAAITLHIYTPSFSIYLLQYHQHKMMVA